MTGVQTCALPIYPSAPEEVGYFIPEPAKGRACPQSNDVDVDEKGLIYLVDRFNGLDILEFNKR